MINIMINNTPNYWKLEKLGQLFNERKEKVSDKDYSPLSVAKHGIVPQMANVAKSDDGDNRKKVLIGDFVINSRSDRRGSSGLSIYNGSVSLINIVLEPRHGYPKFIHHLLKSYAFQEEFYKYGHGIVADLWTTRYSELKSIIVALPKYAEQKQIANFLDTEIERIDLLIEKKGELIELLEKRVRTQINETFEGITKTRRLKNLAKVQLSNVDKHIFDDEIPVLACHYTDVYYNDVITNKTELRKGSVTFLEKEKFSLYGGEVIITKDSESPEDIAIPAYVESCKEGTVCGYHLSIIRASENIADGGYIFWALQTQKIRDYFSIFAQGVTRFGLPLNKISDCFIPYIEDIEEQKNISDKLFKLRNHQIEVSKKIQTSIEKLKELRTSIITEAVTGQLNIEEWQNRGLRDQKLDKINKTMTA